MRLLTEDSISPHAPVRRSATMRWRVPPFLPTASPTRASSVASERLEVTISLNVSAILPPRPVQSPGRRTEKSPSRTARRAASSRRMSALFSAVTG